MKILFISQYYPPEIGAASNRIGYFARFLAKKGHEVSVLTSSPNYPEGKLYAGYQNKFLLKSENNVNVYRTRIFLTPKTNSITRLAHYLSFVAASFIARRKIPKADVILATCPPIFTGLIGVIFKKLWKTPLVIDVRDLWPQSIESVGAVKNKKMLSHIEKLAHWIYKNAALITATSLGIKNGLPSALQNKTAIFPNGAELDVFRPDIKGEKIKRAWNLENKFTVLYTGNLGLAQAPHIFIKTAEILKNESDIVFLIAGAGVCAEKLQQEASQKSLINIIFTGNQPRHKMPEFVAAADICVIPYKKADTFRNTLPSKMFDYMAGGKPILINLKGEASDLIEKAGCGILTKEEDADDFAEKILALKKNQDLRKKMGGAGKEFAEKHYRREIIAVEFEQTLEQMLGSLEARSSHHSRNN